MANSISSDFPQILFATATFSFSFSSFFFGFSLFFSLFWFSFVFMSFLNKWLRNFTHFREQDYFVGPNCECFIYYMKTLNHLTTKTCRKTMSNPFYLNSMAFTVYESLDASIFYSSPDDVYVKSHVLVW